MGSPFGRHDRLFWPLAALVVLWWARVALTPGTIVEPFVNLDVLVHWMPLVTEATRQWREGSVPLWNPYQALGQPLLATWQTGSTYPLNLPYLFLDVGRAWFLVGLLHHLIAAAGMVAFARRIGFGRGAALVSASAYVFSRLLSGKYLDPGALISLAWLPVLFACAERLIEKPCRQRAAALAAVWAMQFLGGSPSVITCSAVLVSLYVGVRVAARRFGWDGAERPDDRGSVRFLATAGWAAVAALLAVFVCSFQLLPTAELLLHSVRNFGRMTEAQQAAMSAAPSWLVLGVPFQAPIALALFGALRWRRRASATLFCVAAVVLAVLSMGPQTPLWGAFRVVVTTLVSRAPVRLLNPWVFCLATLVGAGTQALLDAIDRPVRWRSLMPLVVLAAAVALLRLAVAEAADVPGALVAIILFDLAPLGVIVCAAGIRRPSLVSVRGAVAAALLLLTAVPGFYVRSYLTPLTIEPIFAARQAAFERAREGFPARALSFLSFEGQALAKLGTYFRVPVLNDREPLSLGEFAAFVGALQPRAPEETFEVFMGDLGARRGPIAPDLLNLAGVRFVLDDASATGPTVGLPPEALRPIATAAGAIVRENARALPRAFFVAASGARPAGDDCMAALSAPSFDPRRHLLLDGGGAERPAEEQGDTPVVEVVAYQPAEVHLRVSAPRSGYVVLTDVDYPGWVASVGEHEAAIQRADCVFRAVALPSGKHEVVFRYRPASFRLGVWLSCAALVTLGLALRRRRGV